MLIEIRTDLFKILYTNQRSLCINVPGITYYLDILDFVCNMSILINSYLLFSELLHTRNVLYSGNEEYYVFVCFIILENILLSLKFGIEYYIPNHYADEINWRNRHEVLIREYRKLNNELNNIKKILIIILNL